MPWTRGEKVFCVTIYLETKSFKTVQAKFRRKFNSTIITRNLWVHKFQATGSSKLQQEGRKSQMWQEVDCKMSWQCVRDSVGGSSKKSIQRHFQEHGLSRTPEDKVNQFLPLNSSLTFLKRYDCFLRLRWKMTWCNMNYHINGLHLFFDILSLSLSLYIYIYIYI